MAAAFAPITLPLRYFFDVTLLRFRDAFAFMSAMPYFAYAAAMRCFASRH